MVGWCFFCLLLTVNTKSEYWKHLWAAFSVFMLSAAKRIVCQRCVCALSSRSHESWIMGLLCHTVSYCDLMTMIQDCSLSPPLPLSFPSISLSLSREFCHAYQIARTTQHRMSRYLHCHRGWLPCDILDVAMHCYNNIVIACLKCASLRICAPPIN